MQIRAIVAYNVRRLRVGKGLSQEGLAVDAGIDRTYMSRLERGLQNPTIEVLERIAKALEQDFLEIFKKPDDEITDIAPLKGGRKRR